MPQEPPAIDQDSWSRTPPDHDYHENRGPQMATTAPTRKLKRSVAALTGRIVVLPEHPNWDEARLAWNLAVDQQLAAVVFPESAEDVIAAVELTRAFELRVTAQGTGHNAAPLGPLEDTVLVKTERTRGIEIDPRGPDRAHRRRRPLSRARKGDPAGPGRRDAEALRRHHVSCHPSRQLRQRGGHPRRRRPHRRVKGPTHDPRHNPRQGRPRGRRLFAENHTPVRLLARHPDRLVGPTGDIVYVNRPPRRCCRPTRTLEVMSIAIAYEPTRHGIPTRRGA